MTGFIHQLINEKITFTVSWATNSLTITTNNEEQYNYFVSWFDPTDVWCNTTAVIPMENISDFPQITWSGLIPPTK